MKSQKSLIKVNDSIFSRFIKSIKNIFYKPENHEYKETKQNTKVLKDTALEDLKVLKDVINGEIQIKDLDIDLEKRLIILCNNRISQINKKIEDKESKIIKIKKQISNLDIS